MSDSTELGSSATNYSSKPGRLPFSLKVDSYGPHVRVPFMVSACLCMGLTVVSLVAFTRTRQTPRTARFLSSALLVFDLLTTLTFTLRKLTTDTRANVTIEFIGVGWSFLAYLNVAVMSVERLIVFQWPNFYLRYVTYTTVKIAAFAIWVLYIMFYVIFFSICTSKDDILLFVICLPQVTKTFIQVTFPTVVIVSVSCFFVILWIIKKQTYRSLSERANTTRMYRSTVVVFSCLINFVITTSLYLGFSALNVNIDVRRLTLDALTMINGLLDTCLYVLWYKECRMELLKMFSYFNPKLQDNIDSMRVTIFNIVTYDRTDQTFTGDGNLD